MSDGYPPMRTGAKATCPLCTRAIGIFRWHGRVIFEHHSPHRRHGLVGVCDASGWLVEPGEVLPDTAPRRRYSRSKVTQAIDPQNPTRKAAEALAAWTASLTQKAAS